MSKTTFLGYVPSLKSKHEATIVGHKAIQSKGGSIRYTLQGEYQGRKTLPKTVSKADFEGIYGFDAKEAEAVIISGKMPRNKEENRIHIKDVMEKDGFIRDYVALLDARKMGVPTTVFVEITLQAQADEVLDAFEKAVARIPDVLECHLMAGTADYLLKVVAENTEDFARIHRQYLARLPGVAQMQSSFALRTVFKTTALPV